MPASGKLICNSGVKTSPDLGIPLAFDKGRPWVLGRGNFCFEVWERAYCSSWWSHDLPANSSLLRHTGFWRCPHLLQEHTTEIVGYQWRWSIDTNFAPQTMQDPVSRPSLLREMSSWSKLKLGLNLNRSRTQNLLSSRPAVVNLINQHTVAKVSLAYACWT